MLPNQQGYFKKPLDTFMHNHKVYLHATIRYIFNYIVTLHKIYFR